jgi:hypothetical protein
VLLTLSDVLPACGSNPIPLSGLGCALVGFNACIRNSCVEKS